MTSPDKPPALEHDWVDPRPPIKWVYCRICLTIKHYDPAKNGPCPGPVKLRAVAPPFGLR